MLITQKLGTFLLLCCIGVFLMPAGHAASKTATVTFSATVTSACEAGTGLSSDVSFGTLDFGRTHLLTADLFTVGQENAGAIRVKCTNGLPYKVLLSSGQSGSVLLRQLKSSSGLAINYNLYTSPSYLTVWDNTNGISRTATGDDEWIPVYGKVPLQLTPASGIYTDTVQVTVSW